MQVNLASSDKKRTIMAGYNVVSTGYTPRQWQAKVHREMKRFSVLVLHRRAGKTVLAINHIIHHAMKNTLKNPQYAYIAPTFAAAKRIAWKALHEALAGMDGVVFNETELTATMPHNNAKVMLLSGENPHAIRGIYLDGCVMDETADMSPTVWQEAVRPTLSDRLGWCLFLGTPRGRNHFKELFDYAQTGTNPEWYAFMLKASESGLLSEAELKSARDTMEESAYLQEYECSFSAGMVGAYFAKEMEAVRASGRICKVLYDPMLPVCSYWDLGIDDTMAVWFVQHHASGEHRCIDYFAESGMSLEDVVREIKRKPYAVTDYVLPHDAKVRELSTGRARAQVMRELTGTIPRIVPRVGNKMESISAARMIIKTCWFDAVQCARGVDALESYTKKWDEKTGSFSNSPLHNWASNGADAFQQFAMGWREAGGRLPRVPGNGGGYAGVAFEGEGSYAIT